MTLNIGSLFEEGWAERRHEVAAWIERLVPDIVCLQEAWSKDPDHNTAGRLLDSLDIDYHWVFGGHRFGPFGERNPDFRFGSAIASRWPIDDSHLHALPTAEDPDDPMPASMPWELVHASTAGLDIFTTHLAPAPSHGRHRRVQVLAIDDIIRETRGDKDRLEFGTPRVDMPPILCGDFNAEPGSDEIRFLRGLTVLDGRTTFYQDAWSVAGDDGHGYTQDWRTHPLAAGLNVHRKRIDYVFVGDPFMRAGGTGRVLNATVIADEPLTGVMASDHRGLLVEIEWPSRP